MPLFFGSSPRRIRALNLTSDVFVTVVTGAVVWFPWQGWVLRGLAAVAIGAISLLLQHLIHARRDAILARIDQLEERVAKAPP